MEETKTQTPAEDTASVPVGTEVEEPEVPEVPETPQE